jgi:hypothetical protein
MKGVPSQGNARFLCLAANIGLVISGAIFLISAISASIERQKMFFASCKIFRL